MGDTPPLFLLEIAFRTVFMYVFTLILVRLLGKRALTQLSPFEYIIIITLGSAAGDPSFYPEVPLTHAMTVMTMVVILQTVLARFTQRHRTLEVSVEGRTRRLVVDGKIVEASLNAEKMSHSELYATLRAEGVEFLGQVRFAFLEPSGRVNVLCDENKRQGLNLWTEAAATRGDL
ncbi:MAG: DUF421 domain-containing protein [Pleurocapsa sp. SU_196_0]|nr:DUF421 domain-containing protein [Pleurocapsa sp. SU_196_0]